MSQPSTTHKDWLAHYADKLARDLAAIKRVDCKKAELDIQARTLDLKLAKKYARNRRTLWKRLEEIGMSETASCKRRAKVTTASMALSTLCFCPKKTPTIMQRVRVRRRAFGAK